MAEYNESQINSNETERISAEQERIENEAQRQTKETERDAREATRQSNESTRISKEAERLAEEVNRVQAENIRAEFYEGFNDRLDAVDSQLAHIEKQIDDNYASKLISTLNFIGSFKGSFNFIGDSITYGHGAYGEIFVDMFKKLVNDLGFSNKVEVNNFGVSGYATTDFLTIDKVNEVMDIVNKRSVYNNIFVIGLGTNNIYSSSAATSSEQYKKDLKKLIKIYSNNNRNKVILTVPIVCNTPTILEYFDNYKQKVYELANEYNLLVIDYSLLDIAQYLQDGVHPLTGGHKLMFNEIVRVLSNNDVCSLTKNIDFNVNPKIRHYYNMDYNTKYEIDFVGKLQGEYIVGDIDKDIPTNSVQSKLGKARKFVNNSYLEVDDLYLGDNFSITFTLIDKGTNSTQYLFNSFKPNKTSGGFGLLVLNGTLYLYSDSTYSADPPNVVVLCDYSEINNNDVLTLSVENGVKAMLYVNGVLKVKLDTIMRIKDKGCITFGVGSSGDATATGYNFNGAIDEIIISSLLNDDEIKIIHSLNNPLV